MPRVRATFSSFVPPNMGGLSLSEYLSKRFPYLDEAGWRERIARGDVRVEGKEASPELLLKNGDKVSSEVEHDEPELPEEVEIVRDALARHDGNRKKVAEELGLSERTLYRWIDKYHLEAKD